VAVILLIDIFHLSVSVTDIWLCNLGSTW